MNKFKLIFLLIMFQFTMCFITSNVLAQDVSYYFAQNSVIDFKEMCYNPDGSFCSSDTSCNLTIISPDRSIIINSGEMTNNINYHNYTFHSGNKMGQGLMVMSCSDGVLNGTEPFVYDITANGDDYQQFPPEFIIAFIGIFLIIISKFIGKYKILNYMGSILIFVFGILTLYPGYSHINYSVLSGLTLGIVSIGLGAFFLLIDFFSYSSQKEHPSKYEEYEEDSYEN